MRFEAKRTISGTLLLTLALFLLSAMPAVAGELLQSIQKDLAVLGYDPGPADGVEGVKTQLAIAKFEEANDMPVTGKASLAVAAAASNQAQASGNGAAPAVAAAGNTSTAAMRQECLQRQREAQQKESRWGNLARLGTRVAGRLGGVNTYELNQHVGTAEDVASIANELGLSEAQVEECM